MPQRIEIPILPLAPKTETPSNIERGTEPLEHNWLKNPFDNPHSDIHIPLSNLSKVLNENFISEAIRLDNQRNKIRKMIQNKDWLASKHYFHYWHTLKNALSVNKNGCTSYDGTLYIPPSLRVITLQSIHETHTGGPSRDDFLDSTHLVTSDPQGDRPTQRCKPTMQTNDANLAQK